MILHITILHHMKLYRGSVSWLVENKFKFSYSKNREDYKTCAISVESVRALLSGGNGVIIGSEDLNREDKGVRWLRSMVSSVMW